MLIDEKVLVNDTTIGLAEINPKNAVKRQSCRGKPIKKIQHISAVIANIYAVFKSPLL